MKYVKILSLMAVAAAALMAFAGTASATILESTSGQITSGTKIEMTGTNSILKAGFATVECAKSELGGKTSNNGGASETTLIVVSVWVFYECNMTVKTLKVGAAVVHYTSGRNGGWTAEGWEIEVNNHSISCVYGTPTATNLGTLSGGEPVTFNASGTLTKISGGFFCANTASWTASYEVTSPTSLFVTAS